LGVKLLLEEIGREVTVEIRSDSTSGISIASRLGQGRLTHLELRQLAVQEWVKRKLLKLSKVDTAHNHSDILTKNLPPKSHEYHREALGIRSSVMTVTVLTGRPGQGAYGGVTRGLRMCLAGIIALLTEADGAAVVTSYQKTLYQQTQYPWHLYVLIFVLLVIVVGQAILILPAAFRLFQTRRAAPEPEPPAPQLQLALLAAAAAPGIRLPTKRARMTIAIHRLTVDDLRDLLRRHGRVATGTKDLLIQRALTMNLDEVGPDDQLTMDLLVMSTSGVEIPKLAFVDRRVAMTAITMGQAM
jgi:hypothetical protein